MRPPALTDGQVILGHEIHTGLRLSNGVPVVLTQVEYQIMKYFMENPDTALSRSEILNHVWGEDYFGELKIVDVNVRRLRMKIEDESSNPVHILTVWGYGYKWNAK